jgi:dimeric dUTPase (all-alpha-NTP-PPase superfamily)
MNLKEIFAMQIKLDKAILEKHKPNIEEIQTNRILALIVEIAEQANEVQSFKY